MEDEEMFTLCVWLLSVCKLYELDVIGGYLNIKIKKERSGSASGDHIQGDSNILFDCVMALTP